MSRNERIKLYKKIWNRYYGSAEKLPKNERDEAVAAGYLLNSYENFSSHGEALKVAKERVETISKEEIADTFYTACPRRFANIVAHYLATIV